MTPFINMVTINMITSSSVSMSVLVWQTRHFDVFWEHRIIRTTITITLHIILWTLYISLYIHVITHDTYNFMHMCSFPSALHNTVQCNTVEYRQQLIPCSSTSSVCYSSVHYLPAERSSFRSHCLFYASQYSSRLLIQIYSTRIFACSILTVMSIICWRRRSIKISTNMHTLYSCATMCAILLAYILSTHVHHTSASAATAAPAVNIMSMHMTPIKALQGMLSTFHPSFLCFAVTYVNLGKWSICISTSTFLFSAPTLG
jgi:hypothetical protein